MNGLDVGGGAESETELNSSHYVGVVIKVSIRLTGVEMGYESYRSRSQVLDLEKGLVCKRESSKYQ